MQSNDSPEKLTKEQRDALKRARSNLCSVADPPYGIGPLHEEYSTLQDLIETIESLLGY